MDLYFKCYAQPLGKLLAQQNTTDFWCLFWAIAESATSDFLKLDATDARRLKGRGNFPVQEWVAQPLNIKLHDNQLSPNCLPPQVLEVRRISKRLTWLGTALHVLAKGKCSGEHLLRHTQRCEVVAARKYAFLNWQLTNP